MSLFSENILSLGTENAFKMGQHILKAEDKLGSVTKLNLGEPDFPLPIHIKDEIKRQLEANNTHYCDPKGLLTLREAVAENISQTRKLDVDPERVVVFPGAKPSIGFVQQAYCSKGDEVIYPSPGFPIYESFIKYVGATPVPMHLHESNGFVWCPEKFASLITPNTKIIYLNSPSNPTGTVLSYEQIEEIAEIICRLCSKEVRVYSDEIYEKILFDDNEHVSIASMPGLEDRTIISSGFSKTYAWTGGRIGYAVFPTIKEAEVFKNLNINYFSCVSPYNQEAARVAINSHLSEKYVSEMVSIFQKRRDIIWDIFAGLNGVSCNKPGGAFYLFPNIGDVCEDLGILDYYEHMFKVDRSCMSPSGLFQNFALYHHGVAVLDRSSFGQLGSDNEHFIRVSIAADLQVLEEGIDKLSNAMVDKKGMNIFLDERPDCNLGPE